MLACVHLGRTSVGEKLLPVPADHFGGPQEGDDVGEGAERVGHQLKVGELEDRFLKVPGRFKKNS
jgi:hypothetical protein